MKPALLYLRKYIDKNYQHNRVDQKENKDNMGKITRKCTQKMIFKEKKVYECEDKKVKEFYFKPTKSFNSLRLKQKLVPETFKKECKLSDVVVEPLSKQTQRSSGEVEQNKVIKTIVTNKEQNSRTQSEVQPNHKTSKDAPLHKQVRFVVSPPVQYTQKLVKTPLGLQSSNQLAEKSSHEIQAIQYQEAVFQELSQETNLQIQNQETPEFIKSEHFKLSSKSMKKLGYDTLFDYLNQMKKYNRIKKKQVKEACYYPLACMTPQNNQTLKYQVISKQEKALFHQKLSKFQKQIKVHESFSFEKVQLKNLNTNCKYPSKPKSNFSKAEIYNLNNPLTDQMIEKNSNKFLLEYELILMCNCANKKYFSYKLSSQTDYNSFLRFTTPLLDSKPQKENHYLIGNKDSDSLGLYFCCLINSSLGVREAFFWIGKPIQYYRKDSIIKVIDDFLFDVGAFEIFQSDRLWIVDSHGRSSHIMKSLLKKCNDQRNQKQIKSPRTKKPRLTKRISLSISHQPNTETSEIFMSLLANFSEFDQKIFVKKQRKNISTRGTFNLIYQPTVNHYEKKKMNHQSTF